LYIHFSQILHILAKMTSSHKKTWR